MNLSEADVKKVATESYAIIFDWTKEWTFKECMLQALQVLCNIMEGYVLTFEKM